MNPAALPQVVAVDSAALQAAASIAEEALACHREALILLAEGWQSETGSAIADFMNRQCVHGGDVVEALRRASGKVSASTDVWADPPGRDPASDRMGNPVDPAQPIPEAPAGTSGPIAAAPPPTPAAVPMSPWTNPVSASPWNGSTPADLPWGTPTSGGLPAPPALPDLGGALIGLVAEIAQALGSYADAAPSVDPASASADPTTEANDSHPARPVEPESTPATALAGVTGPAPTPATGPAASSPVGPSTAPVAPPTPAEPVSPAPAELLAAELPPAPGAAAAGVPVAEGPASAVDTPVVAEAQTPAPSPPMPAAAEKAPCEIAADELPKVGE